MLEFFFPAGQWGYGFLNLTILIIIAGSLWQVFQSYKNEVQTSLEDLENLRQKESPKDSDELLELSKKATLGGLVQHRLELLDKLKQEGQPVDGEMLAAISAERFRDAAPIARWATSILVLLGLTGTLVGLGLAVSQLSTLLAGGIGTQEMVSAILATLGRMELAFSTTLAGVAGAVVVGSAMAGLRHQQSKAIRKLEELSSTQWTPLFQTTEKTRLNDAVKKLEETRKVLKDGLDGIMDRLGDMLEQFRKQGKDLFDEVGTLRDATLKIIGEQSEDSPSLAQYVETVKETTDKLQDGVRSTGELLPQIKGELEEAIRTQQQELGKTLTEHTKALQPTLEKQAAAAQDLVDAVSDERARMEELRDVLKHLNDSFDAAHGTWEQADKAIEKMGTETADALRDGLSETLSAVARLTDAQSESVARLTDAQSKSQERVMTSLDGFQETYQESLRLLGDQSRRALNQSHEMVGEIRETLSHSLDLVGERLVESQSGTGDRVAQGLNALGRELRDLADPTTSRGGRSPKPSGRPEPIENDKIAEDLEGL